MTTETPAIAFGRRLTAARVAAASGTIDYGLELRSLIGVHEPLLDRVPVERTRYTRLGAIVLNTALMAALSMSVGLSGLVDGWWILMLPIGLFWGYLILTIDSWLIASTQGGLKATRMLALVPRLIIAGLLGFVIAEPLVLLVFKPSIDVEVREERTGLVDTYTDRLKVCNPIDGAPVTTGDCAGFTLNVANSPQPLIIELAGVTAAEQELRGKLETLNQDLEYREGLARGECAGAEGPGLTGRAGEGPECSRNREKADQFRTDNRINERTSELSALQQQIIDLNRRINEAQTTYGANLTAAVTAAVGEKEANLRSRGLLDDLEALGRLTDANREVDVATWLLRLLLVTVDCLPVLVKLIGGKSTYDELVAEQLKSAKRSFVQHLSLEEKRDNTDIEIGGLHIDQERRTAKRDIDEADRQAKAQQEAELVLEIDRLAAQLETDAALAH